ncbi:hypothetical protein LCGC14_0231790 [marine sediment metagenome]|uniref:Uncharacterized protein n=1 Tax=marine sediment metagenome TaxID=412755 RepID=A0A0F9WUN2_9ZZZZ
MRTGILIYLTIGIVLAWFGVPRMSIKLLKKRGKIVSYVTVLVFVLLYPYFFYILLKSGDWKKYVDHR